MLYAGSLLYCIVPFNCLIPCERLDLLLSEVDLPALVLKYGELIERFCNSRLVLVGRTGDGDRDNNLILECSQQSRAVEISRGDRF
jgi:hypothetical protein